MQVVKRQCFKLLPWYITGTHPQISPHWAPSVGFQGSTSEVPSDPRAPVSSSIPQVEQEHEPASRGLHQHTAAWRALYFCTLEDGQWLGKRIQHSCSLVPRLFLPCAERGNEPGDEANIGANRELITYVEDTPLASYCEQGVIAPMLIESLSYVEDTTLASCCEQGVIALMLANNLHLQLGSKFVST